MNTNQMVFHVGSRRDDKFTGTASKVTVTTKGDSKMKYQLPEGDIGAADCQSGYSDALTQSIADAAYKAGRDSVLYTGELPEPTEVIDLAGNSHMTYSANQVRQSIARALANKENQK